ncbi:MAG: Brp/Blh family beta-carotene 15,15'-dioxygenase, partial [Chloroflexota bacterium]
LGYATVTAAYILLEGIDAVRQKQVKGWLVDTAEIGLLWLFFSTINPILAVGVYFCVWHSVRHITRLMLIEPASRIDLENGRIGAAFYRFFVESAPLTVVSLLILVGLYFLVGSIQLSLQELIALYLVLISMLTLPHTLVVCWMDYRQSVWALRF